jgi:hypothetical protein
LEVLPSLESGDHRSKYGNTVRGTKLNLEEFWKYDFDARKMEKSIGLEGEQACMVWGIRGLPKESLGFIMPDHSMPVTLFFCPKKLDIQDDSLI